MVHFGLGIMHEEGICQNLNFWVSEVKKVKFRSVKKWGVNVEMSPQLRRHKYLMKYSTLYGDLRHSIHFLIFENFYMVFRWG